MSNSGAIPLILVKKEQLVEGKYPRVFSLFLIVDRLDCAPDALATFPLCSLDVSPTPRCRDVGRFSRGNDVRAPIIDGSNRDLCRAEVFQEIGRAQAERKEIFQMARDLPQGILTQFVRARRHGTGINAVLNDLGEIYLCLFHLTRTRYANVPLVDKCVDGLEKLYFDTA